MNSAMFQSFHWYYPAQSNLWNEIAKSAEYLKNLGITHLWLPPAYKGFQGIEDRGYGVYDLYDLGEFDQKGSVRTRWGSRDEYLQCIKALQNSGIKVLADIVINHKLGGDENEKLEVIWVNKKNRNEKLSDPVSIEDNTKFTFPGRKGKYSNFIWDHNCFTGIDHDEKIGLVKNEYTNEGWEDSLDQTNGNYDFLLGNDIEFRNPEVKNEIFKWIEWYVQVTNVDGFRFDGIKHITSNFFNEFLDHIEKTTGRQFFSVGEFWKGDVGLLTSYLNISHGKIQLFDVPLHYKFHEASQKGTEFDLRTIFDGTLVQCNPELAITFVENHDTQPLQGLESSVDEWFKPLGYAIILLREQAIPCVFYADLYGADYRDQKDGEEKHIVLNKVNLLEVMMCVRPKLAYGTQHDYFSDPHYIGWTREGVPDMPASGIAVVISNNGFAEIEMSMGKQNAGKTLYSLSSNKQESVTLNESGVAVFKLSEETVGIWTFVKEL